MINFNGKLIKIRLKSQSFTPIRRWNQIGIIINNRIRTPWNPNHQQFDLGTLIALA